MRALILSLLLLLPAGAHAQAAKTPGLQELSTSLQNLAQKVSPSVVQIFVTAYSLPDDEDRSATGDPQFERIGGSGVILDPDGYIVTNAHVVENATRIEVELPLSATGGDPGQSILKRSGRTVGAQVVAVDQETDLAVLKIEARALPALAFGDSDTLRPGQLVLAFGSPMGLSSSVTMGVVSAVARQLAPEDPMIYIQTDAPINPGNSGGALVDIEGRLVGINTMILSQSGGSEGIGFAAPSNIVRNVFTQIRKFGRVRRGEIGVHVQTVTPLLAEALRLPADARVILSDVAPGSPAERSGLRAGDVIVAMDGKLMENGRQFRINVYSRGAGQQVALDIKRGDRTLQVRVPVVERPTGMSRLTDLVGIQKSIPALGLSVLDLTPTVAEILSEVRGKAGAVVLQVLPTAPYSQQGRLLPGDVIYSLNGRAVSSAAELREVSDALQGGTPAVLHIQREGVMMYVSFRVEK